MNNRLAKWEVSGVLFVFLVGALLHFVFEWANMSLAVAWFASVNESVWEHFKQSVWPMFLYALIEYRFVRGQVRNFLPAKAAAIYSIPLITGLVFYSYTALIGQKFLIVDISIFLVAICIGQLTGYRIMNSRQLPGYLNTVSVVLVLLLLSVLIFFTFLPPHLPPFLDENTLKYGLP